MEKGKTMAQVDWIKGTIAPPESGEYYVILEAQQDMVDIFTGEVNTKMGEFVIYTDYYETEESRFESIGKENPFWKVEAWADVLKPDVPKDILPNLRRYFGYDLKAGDKNG